MYPSSAGEMLYKVGWPMESVRSWERFGSRAALFYPLLGDEPGHVGTPDGRGLVISVYNGVGRVLLDTEPQDEETRRRPTREYRLIDLYPSEGAPPCLEPEPVSDEDQQLLFAQSSG